MITEKELIKANSLKERIKKLKAVLKDFGVQKGGECKGLHYSYKIFQFPHTSYMMSDSYTQFIDEEMKEAVKNANDMFSFDIEHKIFKLEEEYHSIIEKASHDN